MPDRSLPRWRSGGPRSGTAWDRVPRTPGGIARTRGARALPGHRVVSLAVTALMVLASGVVALALAPAVASAAPAGPCGTTGVLAPTGDMCTYTTIGSDTFTVPAGVSSVDIVAVGGQGGHFFIAGDAAHGGSPAGDITGSPGGAGGKAV
ncbi:MAG TPA: hypothetical protein VFO16_11410, partial [Pseudonocardiaceae bacterium]|nr:hypothetical protein [Pseudonocardiaceae bacterium]